MRKIAFVIIAAILIFSCYMTSFAMDDISVIINGSVVYFDVSPCIVSDRTFVPVREVLEKIGVTVVWDEANKMIVTTKGNISAWFQVDNQAATYVKNGVVSAYHLNAAPRIIGGKLFVPIRAIGDVFDTDVVWDDASRTVVINTAPASQVTAQPLAGGQSFPENIALNSFTAPQQINVGQSFVLSGDVSSSPLPLNRVNVKITDKATSRIEINETQFEINDVLYHLSDIDSRIKFGILSVGHKLMEITAVDHAEHRKSFSFEFEVRKPEGAKLGTEMEMLWPVPSSGLITTVFWCDNVFCHSNGGRVNGHAALDIAANENADVISVQDGVVIDCGFGDYSNGHSGYGNYIEVDHGNGVITQYAHLYSIYVVPGQNVSAGQIIGGVGNTGNSTGNHLDFAIESDGKRCDPLYYLNIPSNARCYEPCDKIYFDKALQSRGIVLQ